MSSDILPPIPNEAAIIKAMRQAYHAVNGIAAYNRGVITKLHILNGKRTKRVEVELTHFMEFTGTE